jgi:uncharacterized protein (TIGR03089 family)
LTIPPDRVAATTIGQLALHRARAGGDRPFLTFHDLETSERTELGHATFANWAAKTANLLAEDLALSPGSSVALRVGGHWAGAVTAVAAWHAGLVVDLAALEPAAVAVVREDLDPAAADELLVVGRGLGARATAPVARGEPFADEVLAQADEFTPPPVTSEAPALVAEVGGAGAPHPFTHRDVLEAGRRFVATLGLRPDDRLLSTLHCDSLAGLIAGPLAALAGGAGLVLVPGEPSAATWERAAATAASESVVESVRM